jgi:outer membrane protein assembly factor BamB
VPSSAAPGTHWVSVVERGSSGKSAQKSIRVATSWNQSGFSTTHTGANPYENQLSPSAVPNLNEDWATPTGGFIDRSTPAVAGNVGPHGVVYVGQSSGPSQFLAIDAQTGAKLWASTTTASQWGSPAVSGNRVFVTENGGNYLDAFSTTCLTTSCARVAQSSSTYYAFGAPTVSGGVVYTADRQHALDAFPATCTGTCTATWTGDDNGLLTGYPNQSTAGSVAVSASGWVFVIAGGSATPYTPVVLAAYSTASCSSGSCAPAWFASLQDAVNPHVTVANGIVYVDTGNQLYAFRVGGCGTSTSSCSPMWQVQVGTDYSTPAIYQGVLYTMVNNGAGVWDLAALNAATGTMLWTSPNLHGATDESVPAIADGVVYVNANDGSTFGELWAFPTAGCSGTCNPLWHAVVSATGYSSSPVIVNGTVYDASGDGSLYAYDLNPPAGTLRPRPSQLHPTLGS